MQRTAAWLAAMCLFFVASCSTTEADSSNTVDTSTALAATPSVPETTPPEPTTTLESEPTELVEPTEPPAFAELPLLALTEVPSTWLEPAYIDDFAIIGTPVVLPGTRSMLIIEQRGQVEEGCEGGIEPFGRLVSVDLDSRSSTTLIPELELTDTRLVAGRDGRFAFSRELIHSD